VTRDKRPNGEDSQAKVSWRQFALGAALIITGIFITVTRESVSEWLVGLVIGLGLLAIGVALPDWFPFGPRKE
jgi:uncharacterized membrane protein HdeD (DUF308 family)